jgi:uncharacterized membrane protein (DUF373 family)
MAMENDTKAFLALLVQTISSIILWFLINILLGLYLQYGLFKQKPSLINIGYYLFFIVGSFFIAKYFVKKWKKIEINI